MSKQDRQGVRTAADLERKYNFERLNRSANQVMNISAETREAISKLAAEFGAELDTKLNGYAEKSDLADYAKAEDLSGIRQDVHNNAVNIGLLSNDVGMATQTANDAYALAQTTANALIEHLTPDEWHPLTVNSAFKVRNDDDSLKPVYKVTGNVVTVCGVVSNLAEMEATTSGYVFASGIPEAYRPKMDHHYVCQGSGMNRWQCSVKTDGTLMMSRYGTTASANIPANAWLPFSCTYQF